MPKREDRNIVSLFDGISCCQIALNKAKVYYDRYYASEIDKDAIKVTLDNFPHTIQIGDITNIRKRQLPKEVFLLAGGSPCQTVSLANKGGGDITEGKSSLFFEWYRIFCETNPKWFFFENVPMNKKSKETVSQLLGVEPIELNSSIVSIQNRKRLYWTNIPEPTILDKQLYLKDLHDKSYDNSLILSGKGLNKVYRERNRVTSVDSLKTPTLMKSQDKLPTDAIVFLQDGVYRYPTRREMELMQTVPLDYTKAVNTRIASGLLGNGWTVDIIYKFFKNIPI